MNPCVPVLVRGVFLFPTRIQKNLWIFHVQPMLWSVKLKMASGYIKAFHFKLLKKKCLAADNSVWNDEKKSSQNLHVVRKYWGIVTEDWDDFNSILIVFLLLWYSVIIIRHLQWVCEITEEFFFKSPYQKIFRGYYPHITEIFLEIIEDYQNISKPITNIVRIL